MEIAVLSDIHGNHIALKRCVAYVLERNIHTFFFLGDYTGELAYPQKTMQYLYELDKSYECYFVRGNKEDYWLDYRAGGEQGWKDGDSTTGSLWYTYHQLTEKDMAFFQHMEIAQTITLSHMPALTICHGSPYKTNEKLLPEAPRTYEIMDSIDTSMILCGHTHIQKKIVHGKKCVLDAGAVGVPLYSDGNAQFLILHGSEDGWEEEFVTLSYDAEAVIKELHEENLYEHAPCWCQVSEHLLRKGKPPHGQVLAHAMKLCEKETGSCIWPNVPEKYWKQAVAEMIID